MTITLDGDELLNLDEIAQMLKCSRKQVLELTRSRSQARSKYPLPVIRINAKMLRVRRKDFVTWLEKIAGAPGEVHASTAPKGTAHPFCTDDLDPKVLDGLLRTLRQRAT